MCSVKCVVYTLVASSLGQNIILLYGVVAVILILFPFAVHHLEELIKKFAMLKRNCFASVFEKYFDYQQAGSGGETHAVINYREDESM